jgi:hypothetical protein
MSRIFDALQRSQSETSGQHLSTFTVATELLQAAEQKIRDAAPHGNQAPQAAPPFEDLHSTNYSVVQC